MAQWLCMNCLKPKPGSLCPHCGKSNDDLVNSQSQLPVFTRLKQGRYIVGVSSWWGRSHGYTYTGWDAGSKRVVLIKECALVREDGPRNASIPEGNTAFYVLQQHCSASWETQRRQNLPSLPQMLDIFHEGNTVYAVQEKVEGTPLNRFAENLGGTLNAAGTLRLLTPLMMDLARAHSAGIYHEDITMDTIAVTSDGRARFFDFGAADNYGNSDIALPPPRSPYTYRDRSLFSAVELAQREDIFMMGAVIYQCLTGRRPKFDRRHVEPLDWSGSDPVFRPALRLTVERAVNADPNYQFATMETFCRELFQTINRG